VRRSHFEDVWTCQPDQVTLWGWMFLFLWKKLYWSHTIVSRNYNHSKSTPSLWLHNSWLLKNKDITSTMYNPRHA
jgi:hypothetical protein